jgi:MFS family permease
MSRDLLISSISLMVWGLGEGLFLIFQPVYLQQLGADPLMIGGILGSVGLAMAAAQVPAGYLSDRIGSRPLMWIAWVMGLLSAAGMALATSLPLFVASMLLYSLTAFVSTPMNRYMAIMRGTWSAGRAITFSMAAYNLGAIAGPFIGGLIGDRFGLRAVYTLAFFVFVVSTAVVFFIRLDPKEQAHADAKLPSLHQEPKFLVLLPFFFITTLVLYLPQTLTANFLQNERGIAYSQLGQLGSVGSLGVVLIMLVLGSLRPTLGLLLGQVCLGIFTLFIWQGNGIGWYYLAYFFIGGFRLARAMILACTRQMVDPKQLGIAFGLVELVNGLAVFFSSNLGGWLYTIQPTLLYITSLVAGGGVFLLNLTALPGLHRKAAAHFIRTVEGE